MISDISHFHMNLERNLKLVTRFKKGSVFPNQYWKYFTYRLGIALPQIKGNLLQHNILIRNHIRKVSFSCWILKNPALFVQSA